MFSNIIRDRCQGPSAIDCCNWSSWGCRMASCCKLNSCIVQQRILLVCCALHKISIRTFSGSIQKVIINDINNSFYIKHHNLWSMILTPLHIIKCCNSNHDTGHLPYKNTITCRSFTIPVSALLILVDNFCSFHFFLLDWSLYQ